MNQDDVKALADRQRARAQSIARAGKVARPAEAATPATPGPVPPLERRLRVVEGGKAGDILPPLKNAPTATAGRRLRVSDTALALAKARGRRKEPEQPAFSAYKPAPGVLPERRRIAQDSALPGVTWANQAYIEGAWFEGMEFMGYPYLSQLLQRTEYRRASERLATEMTRKWIKLTSTGDEDKTEKIKQLDTRLKELKLKEACAHIAFLDNGFGRAHLYVDTGDTDDPQELRKPIGDGRNRFTRAKVKKGSLQRLRVVEPVWCYPAKYNANDPLRPDWYEPETWFCMGKEIHRSRLLPFIGRQVPDLLKPSYAFGGLSLTQMLKPYVDNWLDTRQSIARLIGRFSTSGIKTDLQQQLSPDPGGSGASQEDFFKRIDLFVTMAKNEGLLVLDKTNEEFFQQNVPLGTLDQLQSQSQEQICVSKDTLIETDRGQIPISDLCLTDRVMTRGGLAPIDWVGITGYVDSLIEISTERSTVRVTPCHPMFDATIGAFVSAKSVQTGDLLCEAETWRRTNMGSQSCGADDGGPSAQTATTATYEAADSCTASSGRRTSGRSQTDTIFTTATKIAATIVWKTLNCFRTAITWPITSPVAALASTHSTASTRRYALVAGLPSERSKRRKPNTAAQNAKMKRPGAVEEFIAGLKRTSRSAWSVVANSLPCRGRVLGGIAESDARTGFTTRVVAKREVRVHEPVYNLKVRDSYLPEFFANGILTHNCSAAGIPVVVLLGLTPHGLNASSEGEIRAFEDWVAAYQPHFFGDNLQRVIDFAMIDIWGEVDPEIGYEWVPLHTLDEKGTAEVQKIRADIDGVYLDRGALDPLETRRRLAADPGSGYNGIDVEDVPEQPDEETGEGGDDPNDPLGGEPQPKNDNDPPDGKSSKLSKFAGAGRDGAKE